MFTKEVSRKISFMLSSDIERELKAMLDDLISQDLAKMKSTTPDSELRSIAIRKEAYEKLKEYRQHLEDSRGRQ